LVNEGIRGPEKLKKEGLIEAHKLALL